jgi:hypothetical protein
MTSATDWGFGPALVFDLHSGQAVAEIPASRASFSVDGRYLATTAMSTQLGRELITIWDTTCWQQASLLDPYPSMWGSSGGAQFLPGGRFLAVWYPHAEEPQDLFKPLRQLLGMATAPAEPMTLLRLYEVGTWKEYPAIKQPFRGMFAEPPAFSPDGALVAIHDGENINIWDIPPRHPLGWMLLLVGGQTLVVTGLVWWRVRA